MMYKIKTTLSILFSFVVLTLNAQEGYFVKTSGRANTAGTEEEQFVSQYFPYSSICEWKAGQKFMITVEDKYRIVPVLKSSVNDREVSNAKLQQKIFEYQGVRELEKKTYRGDVVAVHFIFELEGEMYYHEVKDRHLDEICATNPRAAIYNMIYLNDVDVARELLNGKTLYTKVTTARVDDEGSGKGYREVSIPRNLQVNVTGVGVGTRECPVKIVFEDKEGNSYYRNVILSGSNSGLMKSDFVGENLEKYFPNVFTFSDQEMKSSKDVRDKYLGRTLYPKHTLEIPSPDGGSHTLLRYTPLIVSELTPGSGTMATLRLADKNGKNYTIEVDLRYDIYLRNENYIDDMFGFDDLRRLYPTISDDTWTLLGKAEVRTGMTKVECKLALGNPLRIDKSTNSRYEAWYYRGRILQFEEERLLRIQ